MSPLIAIIYTAFISLGLPDAVIGAGWPAMAISLQADKAGAGLLSIVTFIGTISASFLSGTLLKRFGTFAVVTISTMLTAITLAGYALSADFLWLIILSIPLGLGGGAIDAALNSYAALNLSSAHINFLHGCWGVGALIGPLIVGFWLNARGDWRPAYWTIALLQCGIAVLLIMTRNLWVKPVTQAQNLHTEKISNSSFDTATTAATQTMTAPATSTTSSPAKTPLWKIPGLPTALLSFFLYCATETAAMLWSATYFVTAFAMNADHAAAAASAVFIGLTVSRILAGFLANKVSNQFFLFAYTPLMILGLILLLIPAPPSLGIVGLVIFGFGCGPIYPTTIAETTRRFGSENTERLMGFQMGVAYIGMLTIPPIIGLLITRVNPMLFASILLIMTVAMLFTLIALEKMVARREVSADKVSADRAQGRK